MNKMIETLQKLGFPDDEVKRIAEYYKNDMEGFMQYILYVKVLCDDR